MKLLRNHMFLILEVFMSNVNYEANRSRSHFLRLYLDKRRVLEVLEEHSSLISRYAFILHDKDFKEEGEEVVLKEPHIHLWLKLRERKSIFIVLQWFFTIDEKGLSVNNHDELCNNDVRAVQYLIHKNDKDKYQYDEDEVISYNVNLTSYFEQRKLKEDNSNNILCLLLERGLNSQTLLELSSMYGKDFIYHYNQYLKLYGDIKDFEYEQVRRERAHLERSTVKIFDTELGEIVEVPADQYYVFKDRYKI